MYLIIAGTNRPGSNTLKLARLYEQLLLQRNVPVKLLSLESVNTLERSAAFEAIENEWLNPASRFIFVSPEYNGSFPGVLKGLFDTGRPSATWYYKKAALVGVATGRAGNLRGMDHLTAVLQHMKVTVYPGSLPISQVDKLMDASGQITDPATLAAVEQQIDGYLSWCGA